MQIRTLCNCKFDNPAYFTRFQTVYLRSLEAENLTWSHWYCNLCGQYAAYWPVCFVPFSLPIFTLLRPIYSSLENVGAIAWSRIPNTGVMGEILHFQFSISSWLSPTSAPPPHLLNWLIGLMSRLYVAPFCSNRLNRRHSLGVAAYCNLPMPQMYPTSWV